MNSIRRGALTVLSLQSSFMSDFNCMDFGGSFTLRLFPVYTLDLHRATLHLVGQILRCFLVMSLSYLTNDVIASLNN